MDLNCLTFTKVPEHKPSLLFQMKFEIEKKLLGPADTVEIRCLKANSRFEYECEFPPGYSIQVNNFKKFVQKAPDPLIA